MLTTRKTLSSWNAEVYKKEETVVDTFFYGNVCSVKNIFLDTCFEARAPGTLKTGPWPGQGTLTRPPKKEKEGVFFGKAWSF